MSWLSIQNHWWREGKVRPDLAKEFKREAFLELEKLAGVRQAVIISGLRRVGKSTMMMQLVQRLIENGLDPLDAVYFSFDERVEGVRAILDSYREVTGRDYESRKLHVFLDEVQKLKSWAEQVKILYDNFPNLKFVLSGSAALPLEKEARVTLVGRAFYIRVEPLSFREFLKLKHKLEIPRDRVELWKDKLAAWFSDYLKRPLPEMVEMPSELLRRYVRESIVDRIVYKDIPEIHGRIDYELLRNLLNLFFENPGYTLNVDSLSKDFKRSKRTVLSLLEYMMESYLIRVIRNYRPSTMSSSRKLRRVYPYHFCLIAHDPIDQSKLMECVAASLLDVAFYWRDDSKEVDFVVDNNPVEVKWQETITRDDYKSLRYFMRKFNAKRALLITKSDYSHPEKPIETAPLWKVAFQEEPWS